MVALLAASAPECAWAQTVAPQQQPKMTLVEPPAPLLPTNDRLIPVGIANAYAAEGQTVEAILKEDGLVRRESRGIAGAGPGKPDGWVAAYEFGDATGAFAAYTFYRMDSLAAPGARIDPMTGTESGHEVVFVSGVSVVRIESKQSAAQVAAMRHEIELGLPKVGGRKALPPLLPTMLPPEASGAKLDSMSVRYSLGPVAYKAMGGVLPPDQMGWDKSLEVATATYAGKGGKGTLTLLLYPTPQIAGDRGRAIEKIVNEQHATLGTVKMRRVGPLVGVTSGSLTADQAEALVQALKLNEIVTFDQKMPLEFHAEVRKTATLLQSIAVFTGILILAAIVIAVFLGGARAGIRVLRGKSAASEPEFLTIDLRDKPKALFVPTDENSGNPEK